MFSDAEFEGIKRQKELDGFADKNWQEWLVSKSYAGMWGDADMMRVSNRLMRKLWHGNIGHNLAYIRRKDVKNLRDLAVEAAENTSKGSAIVVGGGPSIWAHKHLDVIKNSGYAGTIVASDKLLIPLLQKGIIPQYVVSVDGSDIILNFFKSKLFKQNKDKIKVLLHYTIHPTVARYLYRLKADVYWFIIHSETQPTADSEILNAVYMTTTKHNPEGLQSVVAAGNCGVAAWSFSWSIIKKNPVILIGFDMGYPEGASLEKTPYFSTVMRGTSNLAPLEQDYSLGIAYEKVYNPAWKTWTFTDVVFKNYRRMFNYYLDNLPQNVVTISCTEGGALYHRNLKYAPLKETLEKIRS